MTGSPFITIPDPRADLGSLVASVFALKHDMNLLIVNNQELSNASNLTGAQIFSKLSILENRINNITNQLADINTRINKMK